MSHRDIPDMKEARKRSDRQKEENERKFLHSFTPHLKKKRNEMRRRRENHKERERRSRRPHEPFWRPSTTSVTLSSSSFTFSTLKENDENFNGDFHLKIKTKKSEIKNGRNDKGNREKERKEEKKRKFTHLRVIIICATHHRHQKSASLTWRMSEFLRLIGQVSCQRWSHHQSHSHPSCRSGKESKKEKEKRSSEEEEESSEKKEERKKRGTISAQF